MDNEPDYFAALSKAGRIKKEGGKLMVVPKGSREIHDPFLNKTVRIINKLTDRLRGKYANGPTMSNGEPEFGWRQFPAPPIQEEAATEIERLRLALENARRDLIHLKPKRGPRAYPFEAAISRIESTLATGPG